MRKFKKLVLACDGEGASGKSTGAKLISKKYGLFLISLNRNFILKRLANTLQ